LARVNDGSHEFAGLFLELAEAFKGERSNDLAERQGLAGPLDLHRERLNGGVLFQAKANADVFDTVGHFSHVPSDSKKMGDALAKLARLAY
jgi:hypothetical protein